MILARYILREISVPLVAICTVLIAIFAGFTAINFLNDAVNGLLTGRTVVALVGLRVLVAFEVLLPVTLYLSIVLGLGRLRVDGEITAMEACGVGPARIVLPILGLALLLALVVTVLSLYGRPRAYERIYVLENLSEIEFDFAKVEAGRFYDFGSNLVFFAAVLEPAGRHAQDVRVWKFAPAKREVTSAAEAYQQNGSAPGQKAVVFRNGYHYELDLNSGTDRMIRFQENVYHIEPPSPPAEYRRKAAPTENLLRSRNHRDIAELQWRLSTGLSTVLMALLAIPVIRGAPRRSKYSQMAAAVIIFFMFYNLSLIAKAMVEQRVIGPLPGIWWVNALQGVLVLVLLPGVGSARERLLRRLFIGSRRIP